MALWRPRNGSPAKPGDADVLRQIAAQQMHQIAQQQFGQLQRAHNSMLAGYALNNSLFNAAQQGPLPEFKPSKHYPNTLGWRAWTWDMTKGELRSPMHATAWNGPELRCETWAESEVLRGVAGIHARLVPDGWEALVMPEAPNDGRAFRRSARRGGPGLHRGPGDRRALWPLCPRLRGVARRMGDHPQAGGAHRGHRPGA